ncbi:MAG: peptidoglycan D,D-transpeptidase FtsI family protein [Candidatus Aminicenantia bacterium]
MSNFYQKKARRRTNFLIVMFFLWIGIISWRLVDLQVFKYHRMKQRVISQNQRVISIIPKRGYIYDRQGKILATSVLTESIYLIPSENETLHQRLEKIDKLKKIVSLKEKDIIRIKERIEKNKSFVWIKRKVSDQEAEQVRNLNLKGIDFIKENRRFYPKKNFAAHILGGVGIDEQGLNGIEREYDSQIFGKSGEALIQIDAKRRRYQARILKPPVQGKSLVLTIDETIQYIAEKELAHTVDKYRAKSGWVIIIDPWTGEVLALANYPSYNPNFYPEYSPSFWRNNAISYIYEPGSTFKIIPVTSALEEEVVNYNEVFDCQNGGIYLAGIRIDDHKNFSLLTLPEVIYHSSNVGAIKISLRLGEKKLYNYIKLFGFGEKTGIDLPGEEKGILRNVSHWSAISIGAITIGQEIGVTAIQMLRAATALANGGYLVNPRVIKKIISSHGEETISIVPPRKILTRQVALEMNQIIQGVVNFGTGKAAQIEGYSVAGKTGTGQKIDESGEYSSKLFISSFVGFAPADGPAISMIIVINEPEKEHYGGIVAAPCFRNIALQVLRYLKIFPKKKKQDNLKYANYTFPKRTFRNET